MNLTLDQLTRWLRGYFDAWVSNDPRVVAALFSEDAVYFYGDFLAPSRGRDTIVARWIANPEQQTGIESRFEPLAAGGDTGIAHWHVAYNSGTRGGRRMEIDGILVLRFNAALECVEHREWYARREAP